MVMPNPLDWEDEDWDEVFDKSLARWVPIAGNAPWAFTCRWCTATAEHFFRIDPDVLGIYWAVCSGCHYNLSEEIPMEGWLL
jgi:hypothetical protein